MAESVGQTSLGPCGSYNRDFQCSCLHKGGKASGIIAIFGRVSMLVGLLNDLCMAIGPFFQAGLAALMYKKTRLIRTRGPSGRLGFGMGGEAEVVSARGYCIL